MDERERRAIDETCLRLLGYDPQWDADYGGWTVMIGGSQRHRSPSRDPAHVVPLAEALRARGKARGEDWFIKMTLSEKRHAAIKSGMIGSVIAEAKADTLPEALAAAAARAVGEETTTAEWDTFAPENRRQGFRKP